jgi:hypothetical protein
MRKAKSRKRVADDLREFIRNAPEGSPIDEARKFGVDLNSMVENLKLTPAKRFRRAAEETDFVRRIRRSAGKAVR